MDFIAAAKSANHCQRNWSDQTLDQSLVEELIEIAVSMPTKQNQRFYKLIVSTNQEYNEFVYLNGYFVNDDSVMSLPFEERHKTNFNTQLRAPLLLQWLINEDDFNIDTNELKNGIGHLSVGVSAGAVSLVANIKGLKTGFCICLDHQNVASKINELTGVNVKGIFLSLGIGYPGNLPHNFSVRPDSSIAVQGVRKKEIEIIRI